MRQEEEEEEEERSASLIEVLYSFKKTLSLMILRICF